LYVAARCASPGETTDLCQLPLSFLSAFFALNIKQFPKRDGDTEFDLPWVAGVICKSLIEYQWDTRHDNLVNWQHAPVGVNAAVVVPVICLAFWLATPESFKKLYHRFTGKLKSLIGWLQRMVLGLRAKSEGESESGKKDLW
jgi:hypothetical protein